MLAFITSLFFILATPGPGVLSLAGVGSAFGYRAGWAYGTGLFIGSNLVLLAAATGFAAFILSNDSLRIIFVALSSAYLFYLASRVALAGSKVGFIESKSPPGVWGAVLLQVFNPKAYAVGLFVFSNFALWPDHLLAEIIFKFVVLNAIWIPIHIVWLSAGVTLRKLDLPPNVQRTINIVMALMLVLAVVLALWSALGATV